MGLTRGFEWKHKNYEFKGYSVAGQTTSLIFNTPKICFDIAQGLPFNMSAKLYCLSHLHADHGSGINYLLSQRSLFGLPTATIMLPHAVIDPVHKILKEWMKIEGFQYSYELMGVEEGTEYKFSDKYLVKAFPTTHRVRSFGYIVYEKKKKLKKEFQHLDREKIIALKSKQQSIEEIISEPVMVFTGDTQIEFLDAHPDVTKARILFMECTYLDEQKSVEETRKWGHIHLDEIIENIDKIKNEHISLIHLSARYGTKQATDILDRRIPKEMRQRFSIFPRPM